MFSRRRTGGLLAITLALGACSSLSTDGDLGGSTVDEAPESLAFADDGGLVPLRLALVRSEVPDPATVPLGEQGQVILADLLYDGLTEASADGELQAGLAESWTAEDGFRRWTFQLDRGRIDAATVVASFARLRQVAPESPAVALLGDVEAVDPVGDDAVAFTLRNPNAGFAWVLSGVAYSVFGPDPTGSYGIGESGDEGLMLVSEVHRPIEVRWAEDDLAAYDLLREGEVDAAVVGGSVLGEVSTTFAGVATARTIVRFYGLNLASPRLSDPQLRQAVLAAADRPGMVAGAGVADTGAAGANVDGVSGPASVGFGPGACGEACVFDAERARALVGALEATPTLTIGHVGVDQRGPAEALAASLRAVGFGAVVQEVAPDQLGAAIGAGTVDVFSFGWAAPAGSLDAVVAPLFASYSGLNVTRLVAPEVDELIAQAASTEDDEARWDLLRQTERAALAHWTVIPVAVSQNGLVQRPSESPLAVRPDGSIDATTLG